ncbi:MAG: 16S rRNA (guanine(527)-N(7))-methyltransferase RsmG [Rickettsiales bacterium]|jgi:16S rRNA (guanine527-N7)-methyltransferase|nr:16S rRNA (guanine(527)-N(7))-methyltransferase RsmG [Rickettsiales bacterium]
MNIQEKFKKYEELLRIWNARINLVAASTLENIDLRHIKDSAQLAAYLPVGARIIDLGAGAGFPGAVLAILGFDVICVESIAKKCAFLNELKKELNLPNLEIINDRIENVIGRLTPHALRFTIFTARAFAPLIKIFDLTAGAGRPYLLLKGENVGSEINAAQEKYKFDYKLIPSETGPGCIIKIPGVFVKKAGNR